MVFKVDQKQWTYDDLRALPDDRNRYEIIDGELFVTPAPHALLHQRTVGRLHVLLANWVNARGLGEVFVSPVDVVFSPNRVVQPDLLFIAADRIAIVGAAVEGVPDLVVEVLSPSTSEYDRIIKFRLYESQKVPEYWIVDPTGRTIDVYVLHGERYDHSGRYGAPDQVRSTLLAGLTIDPALIFS